MSNNLEKLLHNNLNRRLQLYQYLEIYDLVTNDSRNSMDGQLFNEIVPALLFFDKRIMKEFHLNYTELKQLQSFYHNIRELSLYQKDIEFVKQYKI